MMLSHHAVRGASGAPLPLEPTALLTGQCGQAEGLAQRRAANLERLGWFAMFPGKRMIRHSPADWMIRHLIGEATPELEHLRGCVALCGPSASRKYSALYG
jgi:hypothetical protein